MPLQRIKTIAALLWIGAAAAIGVTFDLSWIALAAFGVLPPLALLMLWNEPPQTLTESIRNARR
jgi:hypothetical protein